MTPRIALPGVLAVVVALALALPAGAMASHSQTMTLQDDQQLICAPRVAALQFAPRGSDVWTTVAQIRPADSQVS